MLDEFAASGGEVLFISRFPKFLDGRKIDQGRFDRYELMPFELDLIAERVRETESPVSISPNNSGVFVRKRNTENGKLYAFLNSSKNKEIKANIKIQTDRNLIKINLRERNSENVQFERAGGNAFINYTFLPGEELVLFESEEFVEGSERKAGTPISIPCDRFKFTLSEDNYLVLDRVRLYDGKKWDDEEFILTKDIKLRQKHGLELRFGEMIQPWFKEKFYNKSWHKTHGKYQIEYNFTVLENIDEPIYLMMEDADRFKIYINDSKFIPDKFINSDIDICFKKYFIDKRFFKTGKNVIVLEFDFADSLNLEAIYLCGKFAVNKENDGLYKMPNDISVGDIANFGLPYYSGKLTYLLPVGKGEFRLSFESMDAATILVNGENIAFVPYESNYHFVDEVLPITYVFNRKNLFGNNANTQSGIVREVQKQGMLHLPTIYKK